MATGLRYSLFRVGIGRRGSIYSSLHSLPSSLLSYSSAITLYYITPLFSGAHWSSVPIGSESPHNSYSLLLCNGSPIISPPLPTAYPPNMERYFAGVRTGYSQYSARATPVTTQVMGHVALRRNNAAMPLGDGSTISKRCFVAKTLTWPGQVLPPPLLLHSTHPLSPLEALGPDPQLHPIPCPGTCQPTPSITRTQGSTAG